MTDLRWDLLTNATANFGNQVVNAVGQIRQRRDQARDRSAVANYLQNPRDSEAFRRLAERSPETAYRLQQDQLEAARRLRGEEREQLLMGARFLEGVTDEAGYQRARALAGRAGISLDGIPEAYDANFVADMRELSRRLNPVNPVRVGENERLIDPSTGREIARGTQRQRWHAVAPGGRLVGEPGMGQPSPPDVPVPAVGAVEEGYRFRGGNPADPNNWEPVQGGPTPQASGGFPW